MKNNESRRHGEGQEEKQLREQVEDMLQRMDALTRLDDRTEDEILGYDHNGVPTGTAAAKKDAGLKRRAKRGR